MIYKNKSHLISTLILSATIFLTATLPAPAAQRKVKIKLATLAPPLSKEQGRIDWYEPALAISCQIRGLDPWPTAYTFLNDKRLRLFQPEIVTHAGDEEPGTICRADKDGLLIATGLEHLLVREVQIEGSRRMAVGPFLQGHKLEPGIRLG